MIRRIMKKFTPYTYEELERTIQSLLRAGKKESADQLLNYLHECYAGCELWTYRRRGIKASNIIVSLSRRLGIIPIPKNACTSLKVMLFELDFGELLISTDAFHWIHDFFGYPSFVVDDIKRYLEGYIFVVLVRDPIKRFISAYNDIIIRRLDLKDIKIKGNKFAGISDVDILVKTKMMEEFLQRIDFYMSLSEEVRHHFQLQTYYMGEWQKFKDQLYLFRLTKEGIQKLVDFVSGYTGIQATFPQLNPGPKYNLKITEKVEKLIRDFYREDFEVWEANSLFE